MSSRFTAIAEALQSFQKILVISHVRPDGDAIGSQLALALSLREVGKDVSAWNEDGMPSNLKFLSGSELITVPPSQPVVFDLTIAVDTATKQRLGSALNSIARTSCWINIDHHASNPGYGDLNYLDVSSPATGQIIYELIKEQTLPLNLAIGDALFTAISTDTGSFRYANTTRRTFEVAADLLTLGVNSGELSRKIYESYPKRRLLVLGELLERASFDSGDQIASMSLTLEQKKRLGIQPEDIDGLIDSIRSIDTVQVAVFFEELEEERVRLSMRSKDPRIDVNRVCQAWGGGGHALAAGARIRGTLSETRHKVLEQVIDEVGQRT
jgi:bifunctional oligoribonuclease and PAP phosphatase NrnA